MREVTAQLFYRFAAVIEGAGGHRAALLTILYRDRRCGRTPRSSSPDFLPRLRAREVTTQFFSQLSDEIEGAGRHRVALLTILYRDRRRGRIPRSSSYDFIPRSRAREITAQFFYRLSAEIKGAGRHRAVLLTIFYQYQV